MFSIKAKIQSLHTWLQKPVETAFESLPSSFLSLDKKLLNQGFRSNSVTELLYQNDSHAAFKSALSVATRTSSKHCLLINLPYCISPFVFSPSRSYSKFITLHRVKAKQLIWSIEQALKSRRCNAVLAWINHNISFNHLRRLQLACKRFNTPLFLFRPVKFLAQASPAPVRLSFTQKNGETLITIVKQPGSGSQTTVSIPSPYYSSYQKSIHQLPVFVTKDCESSFFSQKQDVKRYSASQLTRVNA